MEGVQISHNGALLTEVFSGQSATLKCAGKKMVDDVVVAVPEQKEEKTLLDEFVVTENGTYNTFLQTASFTWNKDSEYDGTVLFNDIPIRYKKVTDFVVPDEVSTLSDPKYAFTVTFSNGESERAYLALLMPTDNTAMYYLNAMPFLVMWVKDAGLVNAQYGTSLEDNSVYVTDYLWAANGEEEIVTLTLTAPGNKADGISSVTVDVQPMLSPKYITLRENGTTEVLPYDGEDGLSQVTVNVSCDMQKELIPVIEGSITELYCKELNTIRPYAFRGCTKLEKATLRIIQASIDDYSFADCAKLTTINRYDAGNILPNEIRVPYRIGSSAFSNTGLSGALKIRASQIVMNAFYNCKALTNVDIFLQGNYSPKYIQTGAFENCTALETVSITCDDTRNDDYRAYIWLQAFKGCTNLKSITINYPMLVMKTMETSTSYLPNSLNAIYVPADMVDAYKADAVWGKIADKIYPIPTEVA